VTAGAAGGRCVFRRLLVACAALALLATACAGGDDDTASPGSGATAASSGPTASGGSATATGRTGGTGAAASSTTALPAPVPGGRLTVALTSEPNTLDPTQTTNTAAGTILAAVAETLMKRDPVTDQVVPGVAQSLTESPDRLSWTMKLRPGVLFHDGTPLDAAAVKFDVERHHHSLVTASFVAPITGIDVVDPLTVVFHLQSPWVALPSVLATNPGMMISPKSVQDFGTDLPRHLVGTGPYVLTRWQPDVQINLDPNPSYWDTAHEPLLAAIVVRTIGDGDSRRSSYESGDVDCFSVANKDLADYRKGRSGTRYVEAQGVPVLTIMNNAKAPFDDARVRQAVAAATDSATIIQALSNGTATAANGPFPPGSPYAVADSGYPTYDLNRAKQLVAAYKAEKGAAPKFAYQTVDAADAGELATALEQMWKDAGLDVTVDTSLDETRLILSVVTGAYDMSLWQFQDFSDPDLLLYSYFHTGGSLNFEKYSNPEVDAALDTGRTNPDPAARTAAYQQVSRLLGRDVPVMFGAYTLTGVACRNTVAGAVPGALHAVQMPLQLLYRTA
jgi:peptide/nickel transport system substrate-binding protein